MRSMLVRKATPTSISEGAAYGQRDPGCHTFKCMGTGPNNHTWRMPILCHVHRRFHQAHLNLSDDTKERRVQTLPEAQSRSRKNYRSARTLPSIKWSQRIFLGLVYGVSPQRRNPTRILMPLSRRFAHACAIRVGPPGSWTREDVRQDIERRQCEC